MATKTFLRHFTPRHHHHHRKIITTITTRPLSTTATTESKPHYWSNPGALVSGVTTADLETNPSIASFFASNFSDMSIYQPPKTKETPPETDESKRLLDSLNIRRLECHIRDPQTETKKYSCAALQEARMVPGLIYGNDRRKMKGLPQSERIFVKTEFKLLQRETDLYHHGFSGRVYELTVVGDGAPSEPLWVIPSDVNMHPVKNMFHCVNYLRYYPGRPIAIPIRYVNEDESPTLKRGGYIIPLKRKISVQVEEGVAIPEFIDLECTGARNKDVLKLDRLIIPEGVTISKRVDRSTFLIGAVRGKREEAIEGN